MWWGEGMVGGGGRPDRREGGVELEDFSLTDVQRTFERSRTARLTYLHWTVRQEHHIIFSSVFSHFNFVFPLSEYLFFKPSIHRRV